MVCHGYDGFYHDQATMGLYVEKNLRLGYTLTSFFHFCSFFLSATFFME